MRKGFAEAFEAYNEEAHLAGGMIPIVQQVYGIKVVTAFFQCGYTTEQNRFIQGVVGGECYPSSRSKIIE